MTLAELEAACVKAGVRPPYHSARVAHHEGPYFTADWKNNGRLAYISWSEEFDGVSLLFGLSRGVFAGHESTIDAALSRVREWLEGGK